MPREQSYERILGNGRARLRVEIITDGNIVTWFVVQLEAWYHGTWKAVCRYDMAHGQPHRDLLNTLGRTVDKQWLPYTTNDALTLAIADIKANWEQHLAEFEGR